MAAGSSNSYVVNFSVYLGCEGEIQRHHLLGYNVVMGITCSFFNRKHHVFFDNFFSSPDLFDHLLAQDMYACATVRCNRKGLPAYAKDKLCKPGQTITQQRGNLLFTKWHDKRDFCCQMFPQKSLRGLYNIRKEEETLTYKNRKYQMFTRQTWVV